GARPPGLSNARQAPRRLHRSVDQRDDLTHAAPFDPLALRPVAASRSGQSLGRSLDLFPGRRIGRPGVDRRLASSRVRPVISVVVVLAVVGPFTLGVLRHLAAARKEIGDLKETTRYGEFDKHSLRALVD